MKVWVPMGDFGGDGKITQLKTEFLVCKQHDIILMDPHVRVWVPLPCEILELTVKPLNVKHSL